ncbi:hypothetical protein JD292_05730 [Leucobacter sp. CSA2]|uniref:DUF4352 domain-containing protein n=1 Tax=Leucobacter edaphi TaxID=2796472 RepID=A0A934QBV2_9MICO|nr:hypothetical protein [Leucobacter edaphi]MBK0421568.1 hypothetical protein [Leucobacter edaphi]
MTNDETTVEAGPVTDLPVRGRGRMITFLSVAGAAGLLVGSALGYVVGANSVGERGTAASPTDEAASSTESDSSVSPETETGFGAAESDPHLSERGNPIKRVGEVAALGQNEADEVSFTVTKITLDPTCSGEYPQEPKNGHFIRLDVQVESTKQGTGDFDFAFWKWIRPDGTTANVDPGQDGNGYMCLADSESLPRYIGPAEKATGSIVLDVPDTHGTLIAQPSYAGMTGAWHWEWAVPAE